MRRLPMESGSASSASRRKPRGRRRQRQAGRNTNDLAEGMRRIGAEARTNYLLGYDTAKEPDGKFRKIRVKVGRKGVRVRVRKGYYAERRPAPAQEGK